MVDEDRVLAGPAPIRVLLVEDHRLVREGIKLLLDRESDLAVAGEAADGEAGLRHLARLAAEDAVDVVVSDIGLPGIDGLEVVRRAKALAPGLPVVLLTMHDEDAYLRGMAEAGADGAADGPGQALGVLGRFHRGRIARRGEAAVARSEALLAGRAREWTPWRQPPRAP